jgi:acylphosphatase
MTRGDEQNEVGPVCFRCLVAGRVQGVFFRASARERALRLGVTGYARNLPDGSVEVLACGEVEAVASMRAWLRVGPPQARVTSVACEPVGFQELGVFGTA